MTKRHQRGQHNLPSTSRPRDPLESELAASREAPRAVQVIRQQQVTSFAGPLPSPDVLRAYNQIVPGLAAKIVQQAESQTQHRIQQESKVIQSDITQARLGLWLGFILCLLFLFVGGGLVYLNHDNAGRIIATAAVVGLATAFIYGTASRRRERLRKAAIMAGKDEPSASRSLPPQPTKP